MSEEIKESTTESTTTIGTEPTNSLEDLISERVRQARKVVRNHTYISTGIGLLPLPLVDMMAVSANQLMMLARLSNLYDVPYRKNVVKSLVSVLLYDLSAAGAVRVTSSLVKSIPVIGQFAGAVAMSGYSLAATYAIGQVFIQHFEAGGTFLDFKPELVRGYFKEQFEEGKKIAKEVQEKGKEKVTGAAKSKPAAEKASTTAKTTPSKTAATKTTATKASAAKTTKASETTAKAEKPAEEKKAEEKKA